MKKRYLTCPICTLCYTLLMCTVASAQKLPNVQEISLRAPVNVKIDGKATEWEGSFQAHNPATTTFYTISNDDTNLYLVLQTPDQTAINKIMGGGITFLIQKSGKKTDKDGMIINFPVYGKNTHPVFSFHRKGAVPVVLSLAAADSNMRFNNNKMNTNAKFIRVVGLKDIDTLISIYNEEGVKAVQLFDNKNTYTCEIAITLKSLGLSVANAAKFSYHILLNAGPNKSNGMFFHFTSGTSADGSPASQAMLDKMQNTEASLYSTTDFWGEYTLIN